MNKTHTKKDWDLEEFHFQVALGFIDQCEKKMALKEMKRKDLAENLGVSEGYISQIFNNPANLTLKTISRIARNLGEKASVILYDDGDPTNLKGALSPMVFVECWNVVGKPANLWEVEEYVEGIQLSLFDSMQVYSNPLSVCPGGHTERLGPPGVNKLPETPGGQVTKEFISVDVDYFLGTEATSRIANTFGVWPRCSNQLVQLTNDWRQYVLC